MFVLWCIYGCNLKLQLRRRVFPAGSYRRGCAAHLLHRCRCFADHGAHVASLHTALSALYPHDQVMGPKVETLLTKSEQLSGKAVVDALKADMDACLANVAAKHAALSKEVDDRSSLRQDIADLTGKIAAMEAKPNPKEAAKLEETKTKLADSTAAFEAADAKLTPLMESLDKDLAELLNGPYKAFMSGVAAWHAAAAEGYNASLAAETAPVPVTPAAEGGAGAAAAPAS